MSDDVIDLYDNEYGYTPPCCRPGGRCTPEGSVLAKLGNHFPYRKDCYFWVADDGLIMTHRGTTWGNATEARETALAMLSAAQYAASVDDGNWIALDLNEKLRRIHEIVITINPKAVDRDDFASFLNDIESIITGDA